MTEQESLCPSCGAVPDPSRLGTIESQRLPFHIAKNSHQARFVTGTLIAGRYRIVGLLGVGGMGEVYRAEDLKLDQAVALKFLPEALAGDAAALARFHQEVRVARKVSHANVCRVFDIGEIGGQHFLSMEYVDGEDLASLLRRIGHLPADKAVEISRQICAGLAAAHENGVLHRDLKPANVMIDGRGRVRITDFGLAGLEEEFREGGLLVAGTPAYMAPEQHAGRKLSQKSDIYALGLVMYEIITGKRAYDASTIGELITLKEKSAPMLPSSLIKDVDPVVERLILLCLDPDPTRRPSSALQVFVSLPGGDPLAAALAAGETPSPEMVAAAPMEGTLRAKVALSLVAFTLLCLVLPIIVSSRVMLFEMIPLEKKPEVLQERARQIAESFGYVSKPVDYVYAFYWDARLVKYINSSALDRWGKLASGQPAVMRFWYREAGHQLIPFSNSLVTTDDPPVNVAGMLLITLDTQGRLVSFRAAPGAPTIEDSQPVDWAHVFRQAGFHLADFRPSELPWNSPVEYDNRKTWTGFYPLAPDIPIEIQAASYQGRPVYFSILGPWRKPSAGPTQIWTSTDTASSILLLVIFFGSVFVCALLAVRNLRAGKGDKKGAFRLALFILILRMLAWVVSVHHVPDVGEFDLALRGLQSALFWSFFVGILYLALEPILRRRRPQSIISWTRLLSGGFRDPLVGRDILIGACAGGIVIALQTVAYLAAKIPHIPNGGPTIGIGNFPGAFIDQIGGAVVLALMFAFFVVFLTVLLRKEWLGLALAWLVLSLLSVFSTLIFSSVATAPFSVLVAATMVFVIWKFGVLTTVITVLFGVFRMFFPITYNFSAWYGADFVLDLIFLVALLAFAVHVSLAGRPLFGKLLPD